VGKRGCGSVRFWAGGNCDSVCSGWPQEVLIDRSTYMYYIVLHEIVREALRRQLRISQFDGLRQRMMPFAEARGYLTDEDVFADVS